MFLRHGLRRNRTGVVVAEPDHDLVLLTSARGAAGKDIVRHVRHEVAALVLPIPARLDGLDFRELDFLRLDDDVGVRLDVVLAAGPLPDRMPGDGRAAEAIERGALAAGGCGALAPEVVVEGVVADGDEVPVWFRCQCVFFRSMATWDDHIPPHIGSPTARGLMGIAAAKATREPAKMEEVNFILIDGQRAASDGLS